MSIALRGLSQAVKCPESAAAAAMTTVAAAVAHLLWVHSLHLCGGVKYANAAAAAATAACAGSLNLLGWFDALDTHSRHSTAHTA